MLLSLFSFCLFLMFFPFDNSYSFCFCFCFCKLICFRLAHTYAHSLSHTRTSLHWRYIWWINTDLWLIVSLIPLDGQPLNCLNFTFLTWCFEKKIIFVIWSYIVVLLSKYKMKARIRRISASVDTAISFGSSSSSSDACINVSDMNSSTEISHGYNPSSKVCNLK